MELQRRFNEGRYWQRTLDNEFILVRLENTEVQLPPPVQRTWKTHPPGTRHQMWEYRDPKTNAKIALVSVFIRPDGMIGGAGKPDPKWLFEGGTVYFTREKAV